ncbi:polysaccharide biosynthesis tyrosine autokinase [Aquabacterium sp. A3]|uniref:polysaccharide biosynthesis tyrosine autokinase n=1 Tax=Aquabacterium sp. A3 TaxID=3132829 RepID=UPI0031197A76
MNAPHNHRQFAATSVLSPAEEAAPTQPTSEMSIGELIAKANNLSVEQIESILTYQRENGVRFGEAAVALGLANTDDVIWALAQQFHYPYSSETNRSSLDPELVVGAQPFTEQAESFRAIRSKLIMQLFSEERPRHALAIISPESGDGKTFFAANIAVAFSQLPGRTLIIDADMRNSRLHNLFKLKEHSSGLSSILSGRAASRVIQSVSGLPSLYVLPVGVVPPNPLELLERPAFGLMMRELKTKFDRIIVDTPAMSSGADAAVVAARCGAAMVIARRDASRYSGAAEMIKTMRLANVELVGSVLNEY